MRPAPTAHTERPPTGQARRRAEDTYTVGASVAAPATKALGAAIWGAGSLYYTEGIIFPENFVRVFEMGVLGGGGGPSEAYTLESKQDGHNAARNHIHTHAGTRTKTTLE